MRPVQRAVTPPDELSGPSRLAWRAFRALTTPLVPDDYVDMIDPLRSRRSLRAKVVDVTPETADASTVTLKPGRGWAGHTPGQFVRIGVDIDGVRLWRAYSVTSGPRVDECITITVKAQTGGAVSTHLHSTLRVGSIVQLEQADGEFVWDGQGGPVAFITGGSGITPVMGILRHRLEAGGGDIVVVHSDGHPEDVIFADELHQLADDGKIRLIERHTATEGRLRPQELDDLVPDWSVRTLYACGPAGLLRDLKAFAAERDAAERLRTEDFVVELAPAGDGGHLTLSGPDATELDVPGDRSILDVAEEAGVLVPSGCRMGICMGCILPLKTGSVRDMRTGEITTGTPGDGVMVQTCINTVAGSCELSTS